MPVYCSDEQRYDRERDLRKHEPRPGERDYLPLHAQSSSISGALEVAILVRNVKNVRDAADLIDAYADAKAADMRLEAVAAGARP